MNESTTTLNLSSVTGFGDWAVAAHSLGPTFYELFIIRRKPVFGNQLPHRASHNAALATLPRFVQPLARLLLAPSRLRPMPTEVMVMGFTISTPFDIGWHVLLLGDIGPLALRHLATMQLNLMGMMLAIPSVGAAAFAKQCSPQPLPSKSASTRSDSIASRPLQLKSTRASFLPSPFALTISLYVFLFVHVPLIAKLAAWAVWLALCGVSAIVYGVQLLAILSANEADRKQARAFKGDLTSTATGMPATAVTRQAAIMPNSSPSQGPSGGAACNVSSIRNTEAPIAKPPASASSSTMDPIEAQRKLALAQVRSIVLTSPMFALVYSPARDPAVIESWLWIVPAAMHILVQGLAHVDVFFGLAFVVWRKRKERLRRERVGKEGVQALCLQ
ncbi:hypothetical protein BCR44DRAFT_1425426 [Catenaria anguillulae PL171]|uniref:Uncharacterized protein n=1 Tax=Catenaria anguillulae PL171 TaxID=765915 RepID=A0A1Y2HYK4_9FUNG|nr:hypothetical protein BCR44DRAFT_1425426 [Catenaria anguillulae PL171]